MYPSTPLMFPIMSLLSIPMISHPSAFAYSANPLPPKRPCSSPESPTKTTLCSKSYFDNTRAASIVPAIPLALSLAPGLSEVKSVGSLTLESISPLIKMYRLGNFVPRLIATTLTTSTSCTIRSLVPFSTKFF